MDQNETMNSDSQGDRGAQRSQSLHGRHQIREVTQYQASWVEQGRGENGKFTLQPILYNGGEECIPEPTEDDIDVLIKLLGLSKHTMFDLERKVLMFSNLKA